MICRRGGLIGSPCNWNGGLRVEPQRRYLPRNDLTGRWRVFAHKDAGSALSRLVYPITID